MRYYIIAGEASGDLHGSNLMKGLYSEDPDADIRFWGGQLMDEVFHSHQSGTGLVHDYKDGAIIGFWEVFIKSAKLLGNVRRCEEDILKWVPDVVILIDYPGFNFKVAEFAHKHGFRTFYYIAPKVWASRESRVKKIKAYVDKLFIVFPFEIPYFQKKGIDFIYRGNPLIDAIDNAQDLKESRNEFLDRNHLEDKPMIALLAGSRKGEIKYMMPVLAEFAQKMHSLPQYSDYQFIVAGAPSWTQEIYAPFVKGHEEYMKVLFNQTHAIVKNAVAAVVNSGTASLETVLIGTPQVVAYGGGEITYLIARQLIKINYISLGNLILGRLAFRELLQYYFTPDTVLAEIRRIIEDATYRERMLSDYSQIRERLGGKGASAEVAKAMMEELRKTR